MEAIEDFIYRYEGEQKAILLYFHHYLYEQLELTPKIKFKIPFYYRKSWICYLNPIKPNGIELAFTRGNELSNAQGLLQTKARKQFSGITFHTVKEIPFKAIDEIVQEAILLDEQVPYASKRKKNK